MGVVLELKKALKPTLVSVVPALWTPLELRFLSWYSTSLILDSVASQAFKNKNIQIAIYDVTGACTYL